MHLGIGYVGHAPALRRGSSTTTTSPPTSHRSSETPGRAAMAPPHPKSSGRQPVESSPPKSLGRYAVFTRSSPRAEWRPSTTRACWALPDSRAPSRWKQAAPPVRHGARVRADVHRRGARRLAHPSPERGVDARRDRDAERARPGDGLRARRSALALVGRGAKARAARAVAHRGGHHPRRLARPARRARSDRRGRGKPPRDRATATASRRRT